MTTLTSLTRGSATSVSSQATASITTTANQLALLFVVSREQFNFVACATPTCTGWTQVATLEYDTDGSSRERVTLLRRLSGSNNTGTHTIDFGGVTQGVVRWSITETDTDVDTGGTNGSAAIVQSVTNGGASVTSLTVTLAAFGSASNATWGGFGFGGNGSSGTIDLTEGSGFTALDDISGTGIVDSGLLVEYKTTNDTTVDCTDAITANWCGGIAVEIKAGASGASGTLATTNANDTSAASGTTTVTGTLATTNAADTSSASGSSGTNVTGTLATTNANDTSAASGTTTVTGSASQTNANDTSAAAGTTTVTGSAAATNADDTLSASGAAGTVTGAVAYTNANDTLTAIGTSSSGQNSGGWFAPPRKKKRSESIKEEALEILTEKEIEAKQAALKAKQEIRRAEAKDRQVVEQLRQIYAEQDALLQTVKIAKARIAALRKDDDEIAMILALAG